MQKAMLFQAVLIVQCNSRMKEDATQEDATQDLARAAKGLRKVFADDFNYTRTPILVCFIDSTPLRPRPRDLRGD